MAGVTKVIPCHGSLSTASCTGSCKKSLMPISDIAKQIEAREVPLCIKCGGVLKPNVTFFGEGLPKEVKKCIDKDREKADLLIVMGTSLKVKPMSHMIGTFAHVPQVLINLTPVVPLKNLSQGFDVSLLGQCDEIVDHLIHSLGWEEGKDGKASLPPSMSREGRISVFGERQFQQDEPIAEEYVESITCDVCGSSVSQGHSCDVCFDFDLCVACFNRGDNPHSKSTRHMFSTFQLPKME